MAGGKSSYPLSVIIEAVDKISAPLRKITAGITGMAGRVGSSLRGIGDRSGLPIVTNALGNVGKAVGGLGKRLALLGAGFVAMGAAGVAAIIPLAKAYADQTGAIGDLANQTGASRERIQELGYAAQLSGSSMESLSGALLKMNVTIANAKAGSKDLKNLFSGLKIKPTDIDTADKAFATFTDRISRIKNPTLQAKAAMMIFGKGASDLLPLLKGGTKGLAESTAEARRLGVVLSETAVNQGEDFGDLLDKIGFALKGVGNTIATAVVPTLQKLGEQLVETIVKYRPQIEAFAAAFADKLPDYIDQARGALIKIWNVLEPLGKLFGVLADNIGAISLAFDVVAGVVIAYLLPSLIAVTTAVWGLGAALLATPVGWILAAIAAIAGAVYLIYKNWEPIKAFFSETWAKVQETFGTSIQFLGDVWAKYNPIQLIKDGFNSLVTFLTSWDLGAILGAKVSAGVAAVKAALPDWTKKLLGIDGMTVDGPTMNVPEDPSSPLAQLPVIELPQLPLAELTRVTDPAKAKAAKRVAPPAPVVLPEAKMPKAANAPVFSPTVNVPPPPAATINVPAQSLAPVPPPAPVIPRLPATPLAAPENRDTNGNPDYTAIPKDSPLAAGIANAQAKITVDFRNLPQGADVETTSSQGAKVQVNQGYSMMAAR